MKPAAEAFLTHSLREAAWGTGAARILAASLAAVDPEDLVRSHLSRQGAILQAGGTAINLEEIGRVLLLAVGKAALPMAQSAAAILGRRLTRGFILAKRGGPPLAGTLPRDLELYYGAHPVPDQAGLEAARQILDQLSGLTSRDLVLILISGGGSALFTIPAENLSLEDVKETSRILLGCGADIQEINTIRKHLSRIKGGQLARRLAPAKLVSLILSDVMGDPLEDIASGLTVPDPSTYADAWEIVRKYRLGELLPPPVLEHLQRGIQGLVPETAKPGDPVLAKTLNLVIGNNRTAIQGGVEGAALEGYQAQDCSQALAGEAKVLGPILAEKLIALVKEGIPLPAPACLICGGETTVSLPPRGKTGRGGRNLELALSAVRHLDGLEQGALVTLATDGEDGVTDAAGAVVTGRTGQRARDLGLDPADFLSRHDSYSFFEKLGDLLLPGPSQTNVNDLCLLISPK